MSGLLTELRVGRLPYLNAWPFRSGWTGPEPHWLEAAPRRLGELARAGALDAALLASRDALALADRFEPLAELGIATRGAVASVLLFSHRPPAELSGARIALSGESRTSRALLRILLAERFGVTDFEPCAEPARADAALRIGDTALAALRRERWPHVLDLGEIWTKWTDLPFVWARWVVRRDVPAGMRGALASALITSLDCPLLVTGSPRPAGMSAADARAYLERFRFRLGPAEHAGLRRFQQELTAHARLALDPRRRPRRAATLSG
jgi:chorismate dehydratase